MTSNYWVSTQCNHWLLSRTQLAIARAEDLQYAESAEEYYAIRIFLINCITLLAKRLFLRQRVTVTAIVFFHRFYSCSPASKVEETPIHIRNVSQEAAKLWADMGHRQYAGSVTSLAEMEFYLLEDLQFHLIVYHPFRSLVAIYTASGKGAPVRPNFKQDFATSWNTLISTSLAQVLGTANTSSTDGPLPTPIGAGDVGDNSSTFDTDLAYGSPGTGLTGKRSDESSAAGISGELDKIRELDKQTQARVMQEMMDERNRMFLYAGDDEMPLPRLEELDEQVLQMAWFVLNDAYRTDVLLLHPPHLVAVAALFLGLVLHETSRERMLRSKKIMDESRRKYQLTMIDAETRKENPSIMSHGVNQTLSNTTHSSVKSGNDALSQNTPASSSVSPSKGTTATDTASPIGFPSSIAQTLSNQQSRGMSSLPPRPPQLPQKPNPNNAGFQSPQAQWHLRGQNNASPAGGAWSTLSETTSRGSSNGATEPSAHSNPSKAFFQPPIPPSDAMTFLAALNVDLAAVAEIVQDMLSLYDFWHQVSNKSSMQTDQRKGSEVATPLFETGSPADVPHSSSSTPTSFQHAEVANGQTIYIGDSNDMFNRLARLRARRRTDLIQLQKQDG